MARRRGSRVLAYVELSEALKYGFQATESILTQHGGILGQTRFVSAPGVFWGANSPKPSRATKEFATGQISSWCTSKPSGVKALKQDNWSVRGPKNGRGVKLGGKTRTVYATMPGGYKYAYNLVSDMVAEGTGELGLVLATGAEKDLVWGSTPKPPVAAKQTADGRRSTFCDPSESAVTAASTKGWAVGSFNGQDTSGA
jgi:hypothetical protein